ncbi:hypothetical protein PCNPT3_07085 [Psychromonas sp. CNPT3]|uniref:hypothetical protein n=1 Tax=Psychromonas sp. CNPT3 TaxID=314282 RepID=UPI0002C12686|nr:hypothetical protein [Psychromonas sp. CNPT3]AGH81355.1 hypothetical protein PCNPT3_07085 [Psychromonas sp. CNPT3]
MRYSLLLFIMLVLNGCGGKDKDMPIGAISTTENNVISTLSPDSLDTELDNGTLEIFHPHENTPIDLNSSNVLLNQSYDDQNKIPLIGTQLVGRLKINPNKTYQTQWVIGEKGSPNYQVYDKGICNIEQVTDNCIYNIKKSDAGHNIKFCVIVNNNKTSCSKSILLPKISFNGILNYKSTIYTKLTGFSDDIAIQWHVSADDELIASNIYLPAISKDYQGTSYQLSSADAKVETYLYHYLFFCIEDNKNKWVQQCFNVGEFTPNTLAITDIMGDKNTIYDADIYNGAANNKVVGGILYNSYNTNRMIGPLAYIDGQRKLFDGLSHYRLFRPMTNAEIKLAKLQLSSKGSNDENNLYPHLLINVHGDSYSYGYAEEGFTLIKSANELCDKTNQRFQLIDIKDFEILNFSDSGWPKGYYVSNTKSTSNGVVLYHIYKKEVSKYSSDIEGTVACSASYLS